MHINGDIVNYHLEDDMRKKNIILLVLSIMVVFPVFSQIQEKWLLVSVLVNRQEAINFYNREIGHYGPGSTSDGTVLVLKYATRPNVSDVFSFTPRYDKGVDIYDAGFVLDVDSRGGGKAFEGTAKRTVTIPDLTTPYRTRWDIEFFADGKTNQITIIYDHRPGSAPPPLPGER